MRPSHTGHRNLVDVTGPQHAYVPNNKQEHPIMKSFEYKSISPADFHVYEARAHQLRAEAIHTGASAAASFLKSRFQSLVNVILHRKHA